MKLWNDFQALELEKRLGLWINALIFLAAATAVIFTLCQLRVATKTREGDQRAWVLFSTDLMGISDLEVGKQSSMQASIRNFGKSPAIKLNVIVGTRFDEPVLRAFPPFDQEGTLGPPSPSVLAPGQDSIIPLNSPVLSQDDHERLDRGEKRLYLYGTIDYQDGFDKPRFTRFCLYYGGKTPQGHHRLFFCKGKGLNEAY